MLIGIISPGSFTAVLQAPQVIPFEQAVAKIRVAAEVWESPATVGGCLMAKAFSVGFPTTCTLEKGPKGAWAFFSRQTEIKCGTR